MGSRALVVGGERIIRGQSIFVSLSPHRQQRTQQDPFQCVFKYDQDAHVYVNWWILFAASVCAASGTAYGDDSDHTRVFHVVTTNDPGCTPFPLSYDIHRQADLQPDNRPAVDHIGGVDMTITAHMDEASKLAPLLTDHTGAASVKLYSVGASPGLLAHKTNPSVHLDHFAVYVPCAGMEGMLLKVAANALGDADSWPVAALNSVPHHNRLPVSIYAANFMAASTYIQESGININDIPQQLSS